MTAEIERLTEIRAQLERATAPKPLHWTQTPEGRERMRKIQRARWRGQQN